MSQLQVDATTSALVRTGGTFVRVEGLEEVAQHLRVRMRLIQGEVPFNLSLGMRYVGVILAKGTDDEVRNNEFVEAGVGTPGVVSVDRLAAVLDSNRELKIDFDGTVDLLDAQGRIPLHDVFSIQLPG